MALASSLTPGSKQAVSAGHSKQVSHSRFEPNPKSLGTYRFGEITPHFAFELLDNDKDIVLRCMHKLRTLPMQSPVLNNTKLHKAYFNVPMQSILPLNYEKWRTIPVSGSDCPADAGTTVTDFERKVGRYFTNLVSTLQSFGNTSADLFYTFSYLASVTWFCSEGNLMHSLGIRNSHDFIFLGRDADTLVEDFFTALMSNYPADSLLFHWNGVNVLNTILFDSTYLTETIGLRDFWLRFLSQPLNDFDGISIDTQSIWNVLNISSLPVPAVVSYATEISVDLRRLHAYNLVCSHFFSNDHVDYVYSAELYRENQQSLLDNTLGNLQFTMNGVNYRYDSLSARYVSEMMTFAHTSAKYPSVLAYFANIFNFNRSLRFMDYFTGSRKQPLAIGSNNVPVVGGNVSVIDITKSIQFQRLRNFANRVGPKFKSFLDGFFGKSPAYDYHEPFFIADTEEDLFTNEIENTGANQLDNGKFISSNIKSLNDKFAFNFDSDRDSVLIGVTYFDIVRFYPFGIPKIVQHVDKFDDFLPELQFIGDQSINQSELGNFYIASSAFGYTTRNQEYKVSVPYCFGGIRHDLPTWAFVFKNFSQSGVSPDFIRSYQAEFDKFYAQLSGFSLRSYFHFIVLNNNELSLSRPMTKNPQIL